MHPARKPKAVICFLFSLFVEQETNSSIRASAQGLFFMMTNGLGAIIGGYASGAVVDAFSVYADGKLVSREWTDAEMLQEKRYSKNKQCLGHL